MGIVFHLAMMPCEFSAEVFVGFSLPFFHCANLAAASTSSTWPPLRSRRVPKSCNHLRARLDASILWPSCCTTLLSLVAPKSQRCNNITPHIFYKCLEGMITSPFRNATQQHASLSLNLEMTKSFDVGFCSQWPQVACLKKA